MSDVSYQLTTGHVPLLISMPHNGEALPEDVNTVMTSAGLAVADTDWHMEQLYQFAADFGVYILCPTYNRYLIDLNRDPAGTNLYPGANSTELCPTTSFDNEALYLSGQQPNADEVKRRVEQYWRPYHQTLAQTLAAIKQRFGVAVLLDAHSIRSQVPRFFSGTLPDFNFGTNDGQSCDSALLEKVAALDFKPYTTVANGRFKGGYITRQYGNPAANIHSIQLELSQATYLNEPSGQINPEKFALVQKKLGLFVQCLIEFAQQRSQ